MFLSTSFSMRLTVANMEVASEPGSSASWMLKGGSLFSGFCDSYGDENCPLARDSYEDSFDEH